MTKYAALVRGINVGPTTALAMADLRHVLTDLGYTDVATYVRSGNAVFTTTRRATATLEREITAALTAKTGLKAPVLVRTEAELRRIAADNPLSDAATDKAKTVVMFLSARPDPAFVTSVDPAAFAPEEFGVQGREVYLWCPHGIGVSKLVKAFGEKRMGGGVIATARNLRTVEKLLEMMD